jgi:hypothetical protein
MSDDDDDNVDTSKINYLGEGVSKRRKITRENRKCDKTHPAKGNRDGGLNLWEISH